MNFTTKFIAIALIIAPLQGASVLSDPQAVDYSFVNSENIILCEVLDHSEQWVSHGKIISKKDAEKAILSMFNKLPFDEEAHKKWFNSPDGMLVRGLEDVLHIVTLRRIKVMKGQILDKNKVIRCTWKESYNPCSPHVATSTNKGDKVMLFLKPSWKKCEVLVTQSFFQIGKATLKKSNKSLHTNP